MFGYLLRYLLPPFPIQKRIATTNRNSLTKKYIYGLANIIEQHYADLRPLRFIELSEQIQQLYDGPWVQVGDYPEDGVNNPNPVDQEKARKMWRKTYKLLKPYEELIYEDYQAISVDSYGVYLNKERQAITAMWALCEAYHNVVELWDMMQEEPEEPDPFDVPAPPVPEQVPYDMHKAMSYFAEKERLYKEQHLPIIKDRLQRWWRRIPEEKHEEAIKNKQISYESELQKSGFFEYYGAEVNPEFYENVACCADSQWEVDRMCADEQFACDMDDIHDGMDILNIEKLEKYIWENQKRLTDSQIFAFLTYEEMKTYLPDMMRKTSAEELVNTFADSLKQDDQLQGKWVGKKQILEHEVDGKTGFYVLEVFENNEGKPNKSKEKMFPKDEFRFNIYECPFYEELKGWMSSHSSQSEWNVVEERRPGQFPNLLDCYLMDASELYCDLKVRKLRHINFLNEGIRITDIGVYQYEPLTAVVFLGVLYAMIKTDRKRWPDDLLLADEILRQMHKINADATTQLLATIGGKIEESKKIEKKDVASKPVVENNEEKEELIVALPEIFDSKLRHDIKAANRLVKILRANEEIICNRSTKKSGGKTWAHTKQAFIKCNFIHGNCNDADFSRAIAKVCLTRKEENVEQTIKNYNARYAKMVDKTKDEGIIDTIIVMFKPVSDILNKAKESEVHQ